MLESMFPRQLTNDYKGHSPAKWFFILVTLLTLARSLVHMFAQDGGAQSIATIPLDDFTIDGAASVILVFGLWGLSQLLLGIIYLIVLWRYQAFIPLMYLLLLAEYLMRIFLGAWKPIETVGTAPGAIGDYILVPLAVVMLLLSLRKNK